MPTAARLHCRLKSATADDHARLDKALTRHDYFVSSAGYVAYLQRFYGFQSAAERGLNASNAQLVLADWLRRQRAAQAREDLLALGAAEVDGCTSQATKLLVSPRPEHVLGTAYVLEGSTLGGAVLLKAVAPLGVTAEHGGRFLASYGTARGAMWQAFLQALAEWDARGIVHAEVERAARAAFAAAYAALVPALGSEARAVKPQSAPLPASR